MGLEKRELIRTLAERLPGFWEMIGFEFESGPEDSRLTIPIVWDRATTDGGGNCPNEKNHSL